MSDTSNMMTVEEATRSWNQAKAMIEKYPEAARFVECRKKWSKRNDRLEKLKRQLAAAAEKERELWDEMQAMKAALPADAKQALC